MSHHVTLLLFLSHIFSMGIFLYGFLPLKSVNNNYTNISSLPSALNGIPLNVQELYHPKIQRMVLIVIDALRRDFIINNNLVEYMPFLWKLQTHGIACIYKAEAHTPTVTLPRIKAMVTGSVPGFADVILNLGSPELLEDNLLFQLKANNHKLIFYGDETWVKLFPSIFERFEGTSSFFVNDYTEVDINVTRHLNHELNQTDWSVMILHYLGLDHIGHTSGPKSPLIQMKLREMDSVIRLIFESFHQHDTLIVVCGDHGISDVGSHGGSSPAEVEVPLVFIMKDCEPDAESYSQIDLTASIATLVGVPMPKGSLGSILPGVLGSLSWNEKVFAAFLNAENIASSASQISHDEDYQLALKLYEDWLLQGEKEDPKEIVELFLRSARKMRTSVLAGLTSFDLYAMFLGIALSLQVFLCFGLERVPVVVRMGSGSVSTLYVIWIISTVGHVAACLIIDNNSGLCFREMPTLPMLTLNMGVLLLVSFLSYHTLFVFKWNIMRSRNIQEIFLVFGAGFHAFSMAASSFVEEEHQTYYYFVTTLTLLLMWNNLRKLKPIMPLLGALFALRFARVWNQTGDKWINEPDVEDWLNEPEHNTWLLASAIIGSLGIFFWIKRNLKVGSLQFIGVAFCLTAAIAYRAAIGVFGLNYLLSLGVKEAAVGYLALLSVVAFSEDGSSTALTAWILLTSMLKRPHNLVLTFLQLAQYSLIRPTLQEQLSPFYSGLAHYWIGMAWYFHQGNGNNLARIDVASGYVGLPHYNAPLVGFLLSCATFSGPALAFLLAHHSTRDWNQLYGFLWPRILIAPVFLIVITSLRYHLFVWTVFSPKLLYECAISCFLVLLLVGAVTKFKLLENILLNGYLTLLQKQQQRQKSMPPYAFCLISLFF